MSEFLGFLRYLENNTQERERRQPPKGLFSIIDVSMRRKNLLQALILQK